MSVSFSKDADFIIVIDGKENSRVLVHRRYDATRENFESEISGDNPFVDVPDANTEEFVPVRMAMMSRELEREIRYNEDVVVDTRILLPTMETGSLRHGINDVNSDVYDSLADFCFGEGRVEMRIPYLLLNFSNPTSTTVHDDYYEHYGVEPRNIKSINVGVGLDNDTIPMDICWLEWDKDEYKERLKNSYYVIRSAWREQNAE